MKHKLDFLFGVAYLTAWTAAMAASRMLEGSKTCTYWQEKVSQYD